MTESCTPEQRTPSTLIEPSPRRLHPHMLALYGTLFGAGMIALALVWAGGLRRVPLPRTWFPADHWALDLAAGTFVGLIFALAAYHLVIVMPAMRHIEHMLISTLEMRALTVPHILWFGFIAAVPEEILFRGALQPVTGLLGAALIFGALHAITRMYFIYATAAGLLLGLLADWSGGLWMPSAAHAVIDVVMFMLLLARWRRNAPV